MATSLIIPHMHKQLPICTNITADSSKDSCTIIITRMFYEHQTFANFAMVDQFATIKSAKPKLLLVNTHDPCQNAIVRSKNNSYTHTHTRPHPHIRPHTHTHKTAILCRLTWQRPIILQRVKFSADLAHLQRFFTSKTF